MRHHAPTAIKLSYFKQTSNFTEQSGFLDDFLKLTDKQEYRSILSYKE